MATTAGYGSWRSPITGEFLVEHVVSLAQIVTEGDDVFWIERRPAEEGRQVIVVMHDNGSVEDLLEPPFSARTTVHEYGGRSYAVHGSTVYFSNFADQRIYRRDPSGTISAITAEPETPLTTRYADHVVTPDGSALICVRERHGMNGLDGAAGVINDIVSIPTDGVGEPSVLASGADFYLAPRVSHDGRRLVYLTWDHPNMPWDGTSLYSISLDANEAGIAAYIAGGPSESISQPRFGEDGVLYYLSDRSGFWNCYDEHHTPRYPVDADCGGPDWQFGQSSYQVGDDGSLIISFAREGKMQLTVVEKGDARELDHDMSEFSSLAIDGHKRLVALAGSATSPLAIIRVDVTDGTTTTLAKSRELQIDPGYISTPRHLRFPTSDGLEAFALYYPPKNADFQGAPGERPPLIVQSHGGPTASARHVFDPEIQFWTSRGFAVVDVDYGGSSGYGRAYRDRLNGKWGIVDVDDCTNVATYLADRGRVDRRRLIIHGGSAGGYTTLSCLTFRNIFAAGASYFGVSDLAALASDTHKFESRYLDKLVGRLPEDQDIYRERSPLYHARNLKCPVIFFQGLEDAVVPPPQAENMVAALHNQGVPAAYVTFEGEQHGFRKATSIIRSIEAELYFYSRVLDFAIADDIAPVEIADSSLLIH